MFLCGVEHISNTRLLEVLGYKEGNLPIKYLGVPFITKKLTSSNYLILVNCIMAKARTWMNCTLSYEGRLQLIKFIIFSI
jgi:hypothetical protein